MQEISLEKGVNVIGVPKTMDNDLASTDVTYGFISAMSVGTEFIDRLQTTAKSHHRVICCELMGRDAGWITLYAGLAGNAGVCLIPEIPFTIENIAKAIKKRDEMGLPYTVVAVAEGAKYADGTKVIGKIVEDSPDPVRYSGLAAKVADDLEKVFQIMKYVLSIQDILFVVVILQHMIVFYQFVMVWLQLNLLMKVSLVMLLQSMVIRWDILH